MPLRGVGNLATFQSLLATAATPGGVRGQCTWPRRCSARGIVDANVIHVPAVVHGRWDGMQDHVSEVAALRRGSASLNLDPLEGRDVRAPDYPARVVLGPRWESVGASSLETSIFWVLAVAQSHDRNGPASAASLQGCVKSFLPALPSALRLPSPIASVIARPLATTRIAGRGRTARRSKARTRAVRTAWTEA